MDPGRYVVLAKGDGVCERRGEVVELREGESRSIEMQISPMRLRLRTTLDGEPLSGARLNFESRDGHWNADLESDANGDVSVSLWQAGAFLASIRADSQMTIPHFEKRTLAENDDVEWTIDVPSRRIDGIVVDSKSGAPVADAVISLRTRGELGLGVRTRSDSAGRFRFMPVPYGQHTITAASATHLQASLDYTFAPPDEKREVRIRLEGGAIVRLRILDAAGAPAVDAIALQYRGLALSRMSRADASGIAEVLVPDGETRDVYVVPREGSFGITRVSSKTAEMTMRLPRGTSRIELRAESEARVPIPNVSVVMRYNKQLIPAEVVTHFGRIQGAWTWSHSDGRLLFDHMPAGLYEFWPAGSAAEMQMLASGVGPQAPASLNVTPGEHVAVLTFARVP